MTRVGVVEAGNLKRFSGTGIDHARAFASMAGSLDMIVPFRIFRSASDTFRYPDESGFNTAAEPLKVRGFLPAEEAAGTRPPRGTGAAGAPSSGRRGRGTAAARRQTSGRSTPPGARPGCGVQAGRQAQCAPPGRKAGPMSSGLAFTSVGRPIWFWIRIDGCGADGLGVRAWRRRGLDTHRSHPPPLGRRLGVGPREVRSGRENTGRHRACTCPRARHPCIFHLAADRRQDPAHRQRRPKRHPAARGPSRRSHPGQHHRFHPPWRLRRSVDPFLGGCHRRRESWFDPRATRCDNLFQAARPFASPGAGQAFSAARCGLSGCLLGYQIGRMGRSGPMIPPVSTKCVMRPGGNPSRSTGPPQIQEKSRPWYRSLISGRRAEHRFGKPDRGACPSPLTV